MKLENMLNGIKLQHRLNQSVLNLNWYFHFENVRIDSANRECVS